MGGPDFLPVGGTGSRSTVALGLRQNLAQFILLVVINAFVGGLVGMERSILPAIAEQEFHVIGHAAVLTFIAVFGISKAITNYFAGRFSDVYGRKMILVAGWLTAVPVPFILMWTSSWNWVLAANLLLGVSQGLTWSTTVIMKIDLVGPRHRGLAMGINEFAGYLAVAAAAFATGWIASRSGLRPEPFYLGVVFVGLGLVLSAVMVRETRDHARHEADLARHAPATPRPSAKEIFWHTTLRDKNLSSISQAGLVNNLNDGMAWGLFPMLLATAGMNLAQIGWITAIYPAVWGIGQLFVGGVSDRIGRKGLIVYGMWVQAAGIGVIALSQAASGFVAGAVLLGAGTAMVYPTLLAAIGDVANPNWRASVVGVYRFWRDLGYAIGALVSGAVADMLGVITAVWLVAGVTFLSGAIVARRMVETRRLGSA